MKNKATKRNKKLEPVVGTKYIMGFVPEIHDDDSVEYSYKLPLGAIKRLIKSYIEEMEAIDMASVYQGDSGSYEIRMYPYCNRMLNEIANQLNQHGFKGKEMIDEIFNKFFKKSYDEMKIYHKNHPCGYGDGIFCEDPNCPQCPENKKYIKEHQETPLIKQVRLLISIVNKNGFERIELEQAYQNVFKEFLNLIEVAYIRLSHRKNKV